MSEGRLGQSGGDRRGRRGDGQRRRLRLRPRRARLAGRARRPAPTWNARHRTPRGVPGAGGGVFAADLVTAAGANAMAGEGRRALREPGRGFLYNNLSDSAFGSVPAHEVSDEAWAY